MMTKAYSRFLTALFCLFIGGLLILHIALPDRDRSDVENRTLAQWPEFSWEALKDGSFTEDVEAYFADQFPLRDQWTVVKARMEQLIGKREFNDVYLCDDPLHGSGTLISKVEAADKEQVDKNLSYIQRLEDKTSANVYVGLIPSAAEIWKDLLPAGAPGLDQAAFLQQAAGLGLPMVDFHTALADHADEYIFYRTDHHWTTLGAYYGYTAVMEALGRGDEIRDMDSFETELVSDEFNGTLYSTSGVHWLKPDEMHFWVSEDGLTVTSWRSGKAEPAELYDRSYLSAKDKYSAFLGGNQPLCVIENAAGEGKILLVRDSYSDALAPFLAQNFAEVHLLDLRYYRGGVAAYAEENGITDIVVLQSIPNFIADRNLVFLAQ